MSAKEFIIWLISNVFWKILEQLLSSSNVLENNHSILPPVKALYDYIILYIILLSKHFKKPKLNMKKILNIKQTAKEMIQCDLFYWKLLIYNRINALTFHSRGPTYPRGRYTDIAG